MRVDDYRHVWWHDEAWDCQDPMVAAPKGRLGPVRVPGRACWDPAGDAGTFLGIRTNPKTVEARIWCMSSNESSPGAYASDTPDLAIESKMYLTDASARLADALASLDPGERDAIFSALYGRANYREVAAASGLSPTVISSRIRRGLHRMDNALRRSGSLAE